MQRIVNEQERAKKTKRTQMIVGVVLVVILVLSTAGYALFSGERTSTGQEKINYNGVDFILVNNGWYFTVQGKEFLTIFNPRETENITSSIKSNIQSYANKPVYFEESSDIQGLGEISRNLGQLFSRVQYACLENCTSNNPIKNCSDNVISIKQGETLIKQQNNCVYISSNEILRASDAFIFKVLGIQK